MRWRAFRWVIGDLARDAVVNRRWWLVPIVVGTILAGAVAIGGGAVAPYAIYPMF